MDYAHYYLYTSSTNAPEFFDTCLGVFNTLPEAQHTYATYEDYLTQSAAIVLASDTIKQVYESWLFQEGEWVKQLPAPPVLPGFAGGW